MSIPGAANPLLLATAAAGGYQISRSLRFNSSDSAYLSRTPASAGNRRTWTWAGWVKRSALGGTQRFFIAGVTGSGGGIQFESDTLFAFDYPGSLVWALQTTQVFRDLSAWYHIVLAIDTTQSTSFNRAKIYVNGIQVTTFSSSTYPSQNYDTYVNSASTIHTISSLNGGQDFYSGYLADIHFIDGQALDPTSFGEFDTNGVWQPKRYSGTYGSQGWKLDFADNSSNTATTLGKDTSGNGNTWTVNNLSVTAGAGNDSLVDVPTNGSEVDTGVGGEVRGNYATWNPLDLSSGLSNGNLDILGPGVGSNSITRKATISMQSGKWYWEILLTNAGSAPGNLSIRTGVARTTLAYGSDGYSSADIWHVFLSSDATNGGKYANAGTIIGTANPFTANDIAMFAYDADAGKVWFGKNGTWFSSGVPATGSNPSFSSVTAPCSPSIFVRDDASCVVNFGQRPFAYTAPSGFKALCTANLPAPVITKANQFFDVALYTGNGGTQAITLPGGMSPDLVWIKSRSIGYWHRINDSVRGAQKFLYSNDTSAEGTSTANDRFTSFDATGFTLGIGGDPSADGLNQNTLPYVAWCWDAGSSTVTNTQGSISSQVRANASAGFSIVTYTGTGGTGTVGHGLGVTPSMIIVKNRTNSAAWVVQHKGTGTNRALKLNTTDSTDTVGFVGLDSSNFSSTTFTVNYSDTNTNIVNASSNNYVAYCFAPVAGYSNGFSYTGNGSTDGSFVYLGFRPRLILLKCSSTTGNWTLVDTAREGYNVDNDPLYPNLSNAEGTTDLLDITSNGFKLRTTDASVNSNAATYIGFAWAESPFNYSRAR